MSPVNGARRLWGRIPARRDESGAALIYALIFTTVFAIIIAAVISLADANLRATTQLRQQAEQAAAAEGAAEIVIDQLRSGYAGAADCFGTSGVRQLQNFYQPDTGPALTARVECSFDASTSFIPAVASAGAALNTLAPTSGTEEAFLLKTTGQNSGILVRGDVGSRGTVHADHGAINTTGTFAAARCVIDNNGQIAVNTVQLTTASPQCNTAGPTDPNYALTATPTTLGSVSGCGTPVVTFTAGVYQNVSTLNNAMACANAQYFDFRPGYYWFDFTANQAANNVWTVSRGTLIAGARNPITVANPPTPPNACTSPFYPTDPALDGVVFIFGGQAQWRVTGTATVEVCGKKLPGLPPLVTYGLKSSVPFPAGPAGNRTIEAQSDCVTKTTGGSGQGNQDQGKCPVIDTVQQSNQNLRLWLHGVNYQPLGWVRLDLSQSTDQHLTGGLVARRLTLTAPASAVIPEPISSGPETQPGLARTVVYLTIYVCPASQNCGSGGTLRLKVKVGFGGPPGGTRTVTIYSWSVQR